MSRGEPLAHGSDDLAPRWEDPEGSAHATVHHNVALDENLVLAVVPMLLFDLDLQFSSELCRHTDGVKTGDSESAVANDDLSHPLEPRPTVMIPTWHGSRLSIHESASRGFWS